MVLRFAAAVYRLLAWYEWWRWCASSRLWVCLLWCQISLIFTSVLCKTGDRHTQLVSYRQIHCVVATHTHTHPHRWKLTHKVSFKQYCSLRRNKIKKKNKIWREVNIKRNFYFFSLRFSDFKCTKKNGEVRVGRLNKCAENVQTQNIFSRRRSQWNLPEGFEIMT